MIFIKIKILYIELIKSTLIKINLGIRLARLIGSIPERI